MMSNVTGISRNLCNKCPKRLVKQISSYSDYFNVISGFTSNSRAPGGPVTLQLKMYYFFNFHFYVTDEVAITNICTFIIFWR